VYELPTADDILAQRGLIDPVFLDSPTMRHPALDDALGCRCAVKVETLNPVRSFKGRGTEALMASLPSTTPGVIATSSGNFGQGLARAAVRRGIEATIVCSPTANPMKVEAMRRLGATVHFTPPGESDGKELARRMAAERGLVFIEDGAHSEIAAGAGTIGQELTVDGHQPDVLLIQVGDGALAIGVGAWMKIHAPGTRIIGLIASGAPSMARSLEAGREIDVPADTISDGMAINRPVAGVIGLLGQVLDEVLLVDDATLRRAIRLLMDAAGLLAEPSGAAGVAALMAANRERFAGLDVATVITGSNLDPALRAELVLG
jgi:threonine dehydratase